MSLQINVLKRILCCLAMCLLEVWSLESSENHNDDLEINRVMRQLEENKRILSADSPVLLVSPLKKGMYPKPYKSVGDILKDYFFFPFFFHIIGFPYCLFGYLFT